MKKFLVTLIVSVMTIGLSLAQPMPNQNPHNSPGASTSAPTQNSISTLSVDHNEIIMVLLSLMVVTVIYFAARKKQNIKA